MAQVRLIPCIFCIIPDWGYVGQGHAPHLNTPDNLGRAEDQNPLKIIVSRSHSGQVENVTRKALGTEKQVEVIPAGGAGNPEMSSYFRDVSVYI